jgi:hypothetical protein
MKHSILFIVFLFLFGTATAQKPDTLKASLPEKAAAILDKLDRELGLTVQQKQKVLQVITTRLEAINNSFAQLELANQQGRKDLAAILTKDQYSLYIKLREETRLQKEEYLKNNPGFTFSNEDKEFDF